jgi:hypothetical protein
MKKFVLSHIFLIYVKEVPKNMKAILTSSQKYLGNFVPTVFTKSNFTTTAIVLLR